MLWSRRRPFAAFALRHGLALEDGGRVLRGTWGGRPVEVRVDTSRIVVACGLASAVEPAFPHSSRGILAHLREIERGSVHPTASLRDPSARQAWSRVLEAGHVACVRGREVQLRRRRDATSGPELAASLDHAVELARLMDFEVPARRAA